MGLEIDAAGVEQDALADQRYVWPRGAAAARRPVAKVCDAGAALGVAGRYREERAGARAAQRPLVEPAQLESVRARQLRDRPAVAARIEHVGRQRGEPAGEVGAVRAGRGVALVERRVAQ